MRKIPMRKCVVTQERFLKGINPSCKNTESEVVVDLTGKKNGHGAYVQKSV